MSELIVERSPVIVIRRVAGDDPRLEYISQNLEQFSAVRKTEDDITLVIIKAAGFSS